MALQSVYQWVMRSGPTPGKIYELTQPDLSIGRDVSNDIAINDAEISRRHARLTRDPVGYTLTDTGSTNGTFVNGVRLIGPHLLRTGEVVMLGENVTLVFEESYVDADATRLASYNVPSRPPAPAIPARQPYSAPPPAPLVYTPAPQPPAYAQPQYPAPQYPPQPEPPDYPPLESPLDLPPEKSSPWNLAFAGCGGLAVVTCLALVLFLVWVDSGGVARWCQFFGFLFGNACP
jgi:hypothetical protein